MSIQKNQPNRTNSNVNGSKQGSHASSKSQPNKNLGKGSNLTQEDRKKGGRNSH